MPDVISSSSATRSAPGPPEIAAHACRVGRVVFVHALLGGRPHPVP